MNGDSIPSDAEYAVWSSILARVLGSQDAPVLIAPSTVPDLVVVDSVPRAADFAQGLDEFERCLKMPSGDCPLRRTTIADYLSKAADEIAIEVHRLTVPDRIVQVHA